MAKNMDDQESVADPLEDVAIFDPEESEEVAPTNTIASEPISPLGPPTAVASPGLSSIEVLLLEANKRIEQLQEELELERKERRELEKQLYQVEAMANQSEKSMKELEHERQIRLGLEREIAAMETELKHAQIGAEMMNQEREARLELERKVGTLEVQAEKMSQMSEELDEQRKARLELEKEKASLEMEVRHADKFESLLSEERQARANAQMRASTAEAKLAQLEGELAAKDRKGGRSFFSRG
jgi:chromosome segregation ATPase